MKPFLKINTYNLDLNVALQIFNENMPKLETVKTKFGGDAVYLLQKDWTKEKSPSCEACEARKEKLSADQKIIENTIKEIELKFKEVASDV